MVAECCEFASALPGKLSIAAPVALSHADAIAVHVQNDATGGTTRWFVGSYVLGLHVPKTAGA